MKTHVFQIQPFSFIISLIISFPPLSWSTLGLLEPILQYSFLFLSYFYIFVFNFTFCLTLSSNTYIEFSLLPTKGETQKQAHFLSSKIFFFSEYSFLKFLFCVTDSMSSHNSLKILAF